MSAGRHQLLHDLRLKLREELSKTTGTSAIHDFPEPLESFNGLKQENLFAILGYMEARFYALEAISMLQTIIKRDIRLEDIDFILERGVLPVVTRHTEDSSGAAPEPSRGTVISKLSGLLNRAGPLLRNIINDHPRRLNLYAYFLIKGAFRGEVQLRLVKLERIVFGLMLDRHSRGKNSRKCPRIIQWLSIAAQDILRTNADNLTLTNHLQLQAVRDIFESWSRLHEKGVESFEAHFTVFPQLLYRDFNRPRLAVGKMSVGASDIRELCCELFEQVLLILSRPSLPAAAQRSKVFELTLRNAYHAARKFIKSSTQRHDISSMVQLMRDLPLLPPCIYTLIARLQRDNYLSNYDRYTLLVFLRNVGLPMPEAEKYFRNIYRKNGDPSLVWTTPRAGHLRRVYRNEKRSQLRCTNFDRYCVWRCGSGDESKRMLVRIRNGQIARDRESGIWPSLRDFQRLLGALGNVSNVDDARNQCATLGCFQQSELPFFSPLGYYFNTKAMSISCSEKECQSDSASEDSFSW